MNENGGEIPHHEIRTRKDGVQQPRKRATPTTEVRVATLVSRSDLELHRLIAFLSKLHPNELTDAPAKLAALRVELERPGEAFPRVAGLAELAQVRADGLAGDDGALAPSASSGHSGTLQES
ncbi:MAG: hypothetical protein KJ018_11860 [Burkholderiales bacterium]|nr:hypothetical protein [Burkholderiales bacterium]